MKKILINGTESNESTVLTNGANIIVKHNLGDNIQIYGKSNEITIDSNSSNLHIYGDGNNVKIKSNNCNLHIFGDHLNVVVENNSSNLHIYGDCNNVIVENTNRNLHIYGTHNDVVIEKGNATIYGDYGNVTTNNILESTIQGSYKMINGSNKIEIIDQFLHYKNEHMLNRKSLFYKTCRYITEKLSILKAMVV